MIFLSAPLFHICLLLIFKNTFIHIITNHNNSYENSVLLIGERKLLEITSTNLILSRISHLQSFSHAMLDYKRGFVGYSPSPPFLFFFKEPFVCLLVCLFFLLLLFNYSRFSLGLQPKH